MESDDCLNVLEQRPGLTRLSINLVFCFERIDSDDNTQLLNVLRNGLEKLVSNFHWLAGQVVNQGAHKDSTGLFRIVPFERLPRLVVKDLRQDSSMPTMEQLRQAKFTAEMLREEKLAPRKTVLTSVPAGVPVLIVQANLIKGGFILCISAGHSAIDLTGNFWPRFSIDESLYILPQVCIKSLWGSTGHAKEGRSRRKSYRSVIYLGAT
jgi:hypothetical protein